MNIGLYINKISGGLINLPWWGYIVVALALTHITILSVTIFLHRCQAHRAIELNKFISHFFRLWLWLTTGMVTKEWAAIHRKHHAYADQKDDPHSPHVYGIKEVLKRGAELYKKETLNKETIEKYGKGTPDDWIEKNIYSKYDTLGIYIMLIIDFILFGFVGITIWAIQMIWIPLFAAGVINGLGHWFGYRNFENPDKATNIFPIGIFIGGEELHNNHHTFATSAKFSKKWYEFDIGWMWISIMEMFKLAKVKKKLPKIKIIKEKINQLDIKNLETLILNRYEISVNFANYLKNDFNKELMKIKEIISNKIIVKNFKKLLIKEKELLTNEEKNIIDFACKKSPILNKIFIMREELSKLWEKSSLNKNELLIKFQNWCERAESSGIKNLKNFSKLLRSIQPAKI